MVPRGVRWILLVLLGIAACRGDARQCEQACRNAAPLLFWSLHDKEIEASPPEQRDALRKRLLGELASKLEGGIDQCVVQCQSSRNQDAIDCLIAARTADQVRACTE